MHLHRFTSKEIELLAREHFGIKAKAEKLVGERDLNYYLRADDGEYILKLNHYDTPHTQIEMQHKAMRHLQEKNLDLSLPCPIPNVDKNDQTIIVDSVGNPRYLHILTWINGKLWAKTNPHTENHYYTLGKTCGLITKGLQDFDHPAAHRIFKWDISQAAWVGDQLHQIEGRKQKNIIRHFFQYFYKKILPKLDSIRKSVIHNDANDYNILINDGKTIGLIDFGDMCYTNTINDLAIALTYAMLDKPDPIAAAIPIIKGFHEVFPLQAKEVELLYGLVAARLIISLTSSAINRKLHPQNKYLLITERPGWELLEKWYIISPSFATYSFREACGLIPVARSTRFKKWVKTQQFASPVPVDWNQTPYHVMDLSVDSLELGHNVNFEDDDKFERWTNRLLEDKDVEIGIGKYCEVRPFYTTDNYIEQGNNGPQWRTLHLGVDVFMKAGTPVNAVYEGVVVSVQNNEGNRDYGPTIILKHQISETSHFYTLYGHLGMECLTEIKKGEKVSIGRQIATIGAKPENGNWPPHLHFQVILDLLNLEGDFPGVAFPSERKVWKSICPNPYFVFDGLQIPPKPFYKSSTILQKRAAYLGKSMSVSYKQPLHIVRGYRQYLYDSDGQRYLDTCNNVPHVGHQHERIVKAAQQQYAVLNTNTRYLHEEIVRFAEELTATLPPELSVCHFVNSGSEANELALRMAQTFSQQQDMLVVEMGYHGNTANAVALSSYKFDRKGGTGAAAWVHKLPLPDSYRGMYRGEQTGEKYASHAAKIIEKLKQEGRGIAGFIGESILSCGGQIMLPEGYLKELYKTVRAAGGVCIADEVQVGFGRVGEHFWGFELQDVVPDIVTMGKPIGNGHPLGAVVCTPEVAAAFNNGMEYFNTFGGNPVSCRIGREVLHIIEEEGLQFHALNVGYYLKRALEELKKDFPIIGEVRGSGLFLGFELIKDHQTLTPATDEAAYLKNRMCELGILISTDGPDENVIKIKPPMIFSRKNVDFVMNTLRIVLAEDGMKV